MPKSVQMCSSIEKGFPFSDPLAVYLLRLMGGYNDLIALAEWTADDKLSGDSVDRIISLGRRFLKLRFIASVFYEVLHVLEKFEKEPDFGRLKHNFDDEGKTALKRLRSLRCGKDASIRDVLHRARNFVTFHYLEQHFREGLQTMKAPNGFPAVIFYESGDARRWYPVAEHVKIEKAFQISGGTEMLEKVLDPMVERLDDLATVLKQAFDAYLKIRSLDGIFPLQVGRVEPESAG